MSGHKSTSVMKHNPLAGMQREGIKGGGVNGYLVDTREEEAPLPDTKPVKESVNESSESVPAATRTPKTADSTTRGLKNGMRRYTVPVKEDVLKRIQRKAFWERIEINKIINDALEKYMKGQHPELMPDEIAELNKAKSKK
jgi:hypothetical protein